MEGDISSSSSRVSTGFPSQANFFSIIKLNYSKSWKKIPAPVHLQAPRSSPAPLQVAMRSPLQKKVREVKSVVNHAPLLPAQGRASAPKAAAQKAWRISILPTCLPVQDGDRAVRGEQEE